MCCHPSLFFYTMNDRLVEILTQRPDFTIEGEEKKLLDFFVEYLDHGSLFLFSFEPGEDPVFTFTNEAQHYHFTLSEILFHARNMKSGIAMPWEDIPFEYVTRSID